MRLSQVFFLVSGLFISGFEFSSCDKVILLRFKNNVAMTIQFQKSGISLLAFA